jgi:hypothetical protein
LAEGPRAKRGTHNISARGVAGGGANSLIGGFVIRGTQPVQVIVRGVGASLSQFGVASPLADTVLDLYAGSTLLQSNDDWKTPLAGGATQAAIQATGLAPLSDSDSAILITLQPGAFAAHDRRGVSHAVRRKTK